MRTVTPFLYMRKRFNDDQFFKDMEMRRRGKKVPERKITPVTILFSPIVCLSKTVYGICSNKICRRSISLGTAALLAHHAASILIVNEGTGSVSNQNKSRVSPKMVPIKL